MTEGDFAVERDIMSQLVLRIFCHEACARWPSWHKVQALAGLSCHSQLVLFQAISDYVSTLESVCGKYESLSTELARREVDLRQLLWAIEHRDLDRPLWCTLSLSEGAPSLLPQNYFCETWLFCSTLMHSVSMLLEHALGRSHPATLLAFKVAMNNFDVTDGTAATRMTLEHRQSQASDRNSRSSSNCCLLHTRCKFLLLLLQIWVLGFKTHQMKCFVQPPFARTLGPSDRVCGQALFSSVSTYSVVFLITALLRRWDIHWHVRSSWNLATTILIPMRCCLKLSTTFPALFLHGKRLGGRQEKGCELSRGHCKMKLESKSSVSLSHCLCCGSYDIVRQNWPRVSRNVVCFSSDRDTASR